MRFSGFHSVRSEQQKMSMLSFFPFTAANACVVASQPKKCMAWKEINSPKSSHASFSSASGTSPRHIDDLNPTSFPSTAWAQRCEAHSKSAPPPKLNGHPNDAYRDLHVWIRCASVPKPEPQKHSELWNLAQKLITWPLGGAALQHKFTKQKVASQYIKRRSPHA